MQNELYETQDLYTAAALRSAGFDLIKIVRDERNSRRATFCFESVLTTSEGSFLIEDAVKDYWDYALTLPIRKFVDSLQELRTRVFEVVQ